MTPRTLKQIKQRIRSFLIVVESLAKYWKDFPHYTLLSVLVQNAGHDAVDCYGYSHEEAVTKLYEILNLLKQISDYEGSYLEQYIYREIDMIIVGLTNAEFDDNENY